MFQLLILSVLNLKVKRDNEHLWNNYAAAFLENHTRNESSMSETSDEEVDYGSLESIANPPTGSDHAWSTFENDSQQ